MVSSLLVQRYARALASALDASGREEAEALCIRLLQALEKHGALAHTLANKSFPAAQRGAAATAVAEKLGMPAVMLRFLAVLTENNRLDILPAILRAAVGSYRSAGEGEAIAVTVPAAPAAAEKKTLEKKARALFKSAGGEVAFTVDPALLGGFQAQQGSVFHDHSVSGKLARLRRHLLAA